MYKHFPSSVIHHAPIRKMTQFHQQEWIHFNILYKETLYINENKWMSAIQSLDKHMEESPKYSNKQKKSEQKYILYNSFFLKVNTKKKLNYSIWRFTHKY